MMKMFLAIIFSFSTSYAWDCPKTYDAFKVEILKLDEKATKLAESEGSKKLLYETGESGELLTLLGVGDLDKDGTVAGFAMQCWTYWYEFLGSMKEESTRSTKRLRKEILDKWETCFINLYPNKSIGKDIVACHRSLTK